MNINRERKWILITIVAICLLVTRVDYTFSQELPPESEKGPEKKIEDPELHYLNQLSLEELFNVKVTTATKTKMTLREAPASMHVLNEKQIKARGYKTLSEALHDVPGFDFQHTYGVFPDLVHQRGLVGNNQRTLVYINGVPDNNISENAILGGSIRYPLHNVKRIEIVSGPASSIYGANAFNGVINIITKDGEDDPGVGIQTLAGSWFSRNYWGGGGSISARNSFIVEETNISYSVSAYYFNSQGPDFRDTYEYYPSLGRGYFWSHNYNNSHEDTYNVSAQFRFGNLRFQTVSWQYLQGDGTFANGTDQIDTDRGPFIGSSWDFRNNSLAVGYLFEFSDQINLDNEIIIRQTEVLNSSHETYPNTPGIDAYERPLDVTLGSNWERQDYAFEIKEQLAITPFESLLITTGLEFAFTSVPKGYGDFRRHKYKNYAAYSLFVLRPFEILSLSAGYRCDYNTNYGSSHTPRAGIVITPDDFTVKLLFSTGFRAPTAWELFNETGQRYSNPNLQPERLISGELGLGYLFLNAINLNALGFYNRISNLIIEVPAGLKNQNKNVGNAEVYGFELKVDIRITNIISIYCNYTYSYGIYSNLPVNITPPTTLYGRGIPNIAPHKINGGITVYPISELSIHLRFNYIHQRNTLLTNLVREVPGYILFHGNIRWDNLFVKDLFLQVTLKNILNRDAFDPGIRTATGGYYPTMHPLEGRNIWVSIGYKI